MGIPAQARGMTLPAGAAEAPAPGLFDAIGASFRTGYRDLAGSDIDEKTKSYSPLVQALTGANGQPWARYTNPHTGQTDDDLVWSEIAAMRAKRPDFLKEVGTRDQWEQAEEKRLVTQHARDVHDEANSGWAPWLIGKAGVAAMDPINWAGAMFGGGAGGSLAKMAIREAGINALLETAEQPFIAVQRAKRGETLTLGEAAGNIAGAGLFGAAFSLGGHAIGAATEKVAGSIYDRLPAEWLNRLSPTSRAAADILDREAEIAAANPFPRNGAGVAAHEDLLGDALRSAIGSAPMPSLKARMQAGVAANAIRPPLQTYRPRGAGAAIDQGIVSFFVERGLSEAAARGAAAGIAAESGNAADAINPVSGAFGLGQHLGARKDALFARYGRNPTRAQQLEFILSELKGGDAGGKHVLAAASEADALDAYIRKFMRPAAGRETDGDLARGMAALGHEGEMPAGAMGEDDAALAAIEGELRDATMARTQSAAAVADSAPLPASATIAATDGMPPLHVGRVPTSAINVDAGLMQFKSGGDAMGITDRLNGVEQWNPLLAGRVVLWEREDGRLFAADGHQRVGLAKRVGQREGRDIPHDALILREADGVTAADARMLAATKNIAEGSGSVIDAAKVLRAGGQQLAQLLPPRSSLVRDGRALARLSDDAFGAVVNDVVKPEYGAIIGQVAGDEPGTHMRLVELLAKTKPANRAQAESIVRDGIAAGFVDGEQADMFGQLDIGKSLLLERAKVKDAAIGRLAKLKSVFRTAGDNAATLEGGGVGAIDRVKAAKEAMDNAQAAELIQRAANVAGPIKDAIDKAARRYAGGEALDRVTGDLVNDIRAVDLRDALMVRDRLDDAAAARSPEGFLDPQPDLHPQAVSDLFGDPNGPAVVQQLDSLQHDLKAQLAPPTFTTAKGSTYRVESNGATTRDKAARAEHPGEQGPQPTSQQTFYATRDDMNKLALMQATSDTKYRIVVKDGWAAIEVASGPDAGKVVKDTPIKVQEQPQVGLHPVELWKNGERVHFGNEIVGLRGSVLDGQAGKAAEGALSPAESHYRLSEDGPEITAAELLAQFDEQDAAIAAVRGCL